MHLLIHPVDDEGRGVPGQLDGCINAETRLKQGDRLDEHVIVSHEILAALRFIEGRVVAEIRSMIEQPSSPEIPRPPDVIDRPPPDVTPIPPPDIPPPAGPPDIQPPPGPERRRPEP